MEGKKQNQNQKQLPASCSRVTKPISSAIQKHQEPPCFLLEVCHSATKMLQVQKLEEKSPLPTRTQLCQPLLTTQRKQKTEAFSHLSQAVSRSQLLFTFALKMIIDAYHSQNQITLSLHRSSSIGNPLHSLKAQPADFGSPFPNAQH